MGRNRFGPPASHDDPTHMERVKGIEPSSSAWKAEVLPLNYTRRPSKDSSDTACKTRQIPAAARPCWLLHPPEARLRMPPYSLWTTSRDSSSVRQGPSCPRSPIFCTGCPAWPSGGPTSTLTQTLVEGGGFEPPKAEPADLQSAPFGHSGTPPGKLEDSAAARQGCQPPIGGVAGAWTDRAQQTHNCKVTATPITKPVPRMAPGSEALVGWARRSGSRRRRIRQPTYIAQRAPL